MIHVTADVVTNPEPQRLRHTTKITDKTLWSAREELRVPGEQLLRVIEISLMMFGVMQFHRLSIEVRLQRLIGKSERWQRPVEGGRRDHGRHRGRGSPT